MGSTTVNAASTCPQSICPLREATRSDRQERNVDIGPVHHAFILCRPPQDGKVPFENGCLYGFGKQPRKLFDPYTSPDPSRLVDRSRDLDGDGEWDIVVYEEEGWGRGDHAPAPVVDKGGLALAGGRVLETRVRIRGCPPRRGG